MQYHGKNQFYRGVIFVCYPFFFLSWRPHVLGVENIPASGGVALVCNHRNFWDPFELAFSIKSRQIHFMAKSELFRFKPLGWFIQKINGFPVNRKTADIASVKQAISIIQNGNVLGIFPEGTRSKTGELGEFQKGAAVIALRANVPIVPAYIYRKTRWSRVEIIFGKPIDVNQLTQNVEKSEQVDVVNAALRNAVLELGEELRKK